MSPFSPWHTLPLFVAGATSFGGLWPLWNAKAAMLEFGLPPRIADTTSAQPVMILCSGRTTALGFLVFKFYFSGQLAAVDTCLATMGFYLGALDAYVLWRAGMRDAAVSKRLIPSVLIGLWGLLGCTSY